MLSLGKVTSIFKFGAFLCTNISFPIETRLPGIYFQLYFAIPRVLEFSVPLGKIHIVVSWWYSGKSLLSSELHWLVFVLVFYSCCNKSLQIAKMTRTLFYGSLRSIVRLTYYRSNINGWAWLYFFLKD